MEKIRPSSSLADRISRRVQRALGVKPPRTAAVQVRPSGDTSSRKNTATDGKRKGNTRERINRLMSMFDSPFEQTRDQRIRTYREIFEEVPELSSALGVKADFIVGTPNTEDGFTLEFAEDARPEIREACERSWLSIDPAEWGRSKMAEGMGLGDSAVRLVMEDDTIVGEQHIFPEHFRIMIDPDTGFISHYLWKRPGAVKPVILAPFEVLHYAHDPEPGILYGRSMFHSARGIWRKHEAVDDILAMLALRRASGDLYWLWPQPAGNGNYDVGEWIDEALNAAQFEQVFDTEGKMRARAAQTVETAPKIVPYRVLTEKPEMAQAMKPTPVQISPPNIEQLIKLANYYQDRFFVASGVPKALVGLERDVNSRATLEQQGVHFMMSVRRDQGALKRLYRARVYREAMLNGYIPRDGEVLVKLPKTSPFDEMLRATMSKDRASSVRAAVDSGTPLPMALRLFGGFTDREINGVLEKLEMSAQDLLDAAQDRAGQRARRLQRNGSPDDAE